MPAKIVYLSLGSNLGVREENLSRAVRKLGEHDIRVLRESFLYVTEPVGREAQNWFLNCVVEAETGLMPRQLLHALQQIETKMGRKRMVRRGPRVIDLDILLYGSSVIRAEDLEVPHPRMAERRFVLVPLAEIASALWHPVEGKTVADLLADTPDQSAVRLWKTSLTKKTGD